mmetsp:Transcript_1583/g.4719  ORF Transcript_1583/g.4719 Transcript_1583/m.4719 type:complete len:165 (+) Transcript_1583:18-512(+)
MRRLSSLVALWWSLAPSAARLECGMGWGQFNDDNLRLRIEKTWTRVCLSYCFVLRTDDPAKMRAVVGGTWDEQQFYRRFGVRACGGMLGTALHIADETACAARTIDVTENWHGHALATPVTMAMACCDHQGGCTTSGAAATFRSGLLFFGAPLTLMLLFFVVEL